ncbi:MAG: decarboxylating 6-phosphogluconate dehydrogenase [Firmicutes bacterium]|nr:decarboxylating 6-phosphogluconate dehydrogenase [Bacillota bacterium]
MEVGIIGLGRMGLNMARRLLRNGHTVYGWNRSPEPIQEAVSAGAIGLNALEQMRRMTKPRVVWSMVPAGKPTEEIITQLSDLLEPGDMVVDGANSFYQDSIARYEKLKKKNIHFLDVGVSGGIWGLEMGYCLMIGGERAPYERAEPLFRSLAPAAGYAHVGGPGAGHFVKMVHNGIEYGLMQAYAEGFELLRASGYNLQLQQIAHLWNHGSVIRSWLLELAELAFRNDPDLDTIQGYVEDSGMGRWTVAEAIARGVPVPAITLALQMRLRSRQPESFQAKVLAALRHQFGGHAVKTATEES